MALRNLNIPGVAFRWDPNAVSVLLKSKDGEVAKDVQRRAYAVQKRAKRRAPYRYGTLRRGIKVESVRESPIGPYSTVSSNAKHTWYVIAGRPEVSADERYTRKAEARFAKGKKAANTHDLLPALRFQPKRGARFIFRYGPVAAVKPNNFMEDSIDAALD